jgi:hypothetical protein
MKRILPVALSGFLFPLAVVAQEVPSYKNAIRLGVEQVGLDAPDGVGKRFLVRYTRFFCNERLALGTSLGYMSALNRRYLPGAADYYVDGARRQRRTLDVDLAFDVLGSKRHAFRIGGGPSVWYRKDALENYIKYTYHSDGTVSNIDVSWRTVKGTSLGFNVALEYEYAIKQRFTVAPRMSFASFRNGGQSTILGLHAGYCF